MTITVALGGAKNAGKTKLAQALGAGATNVGSDAATGATLVTTRTGTREYLFVDAPADRVEAVIARGVNVLVLVVSAADGPLPATRAHATAAIFARAPVLAYIDVPDGLDVELVDLVEMELRELLAAANAASTPELATVVRSVPTHSVQGHGHGRVETSSAGGLAALAAALDATFVQS